MRLAVLYENWFKPTLILKLQVNSLIALDNAPYHSRLEKKILNTSCTKGTTQEFLIDNNYFKNLQVIECVKLFNCSRYYVVTIAKTYNHAVLRHIHIVLRHI